MHSLFQFCEMEIENKKAVFLIGGTVFFSVVSYALNKYLALFLSSKNAILKI